MAKFVPAEHGATAFNCPRCGAYAKQTWRGAEFKGTTILISDLLVSQCSHCSGLAYWYQGNIIVPLTSLAPMAHDAMPESVLPDFEEARAVFNSSPRSSAALLRLATQKLCIVLGLPGKNLNDDIAELVSRGLPVRIQKALDVVRVVGNNQVHPGVLDVRDDQGIALATFDLVNLIVEVMVAQPKQVDDLFGKLPASARKAIEERNVKAVSKKS